eukprot:514281_1
MLLILLGVAGCLHCSIKSSLYDDMHCSDEKDTTKLQNNDVVICFISNTKIFCSAYFLFSPMVAKIVVGDRVKIKKIIILVGTVRFIGEIKGRNGIWYGVELDESKGDNNGNLKGITYFETTMRYR